MRRAIVLLSLALGLPAYATSTSGLEGDWQVDLSTEPGKPYTQPMRLVLATDGSVTGSFYGSEIEAGRWKASRGRLCASFRTTDGKGPYHTAVCLDADGTAAIGQTWAEHRAFLFNWNATRASPAEATAP